MSGQTSVAVDPGPLGWRLPTALVLTALVTLCIELDFTRLVSLLFVPNDAYWVVAIALLGSGIGGAALAVIGPRLRSGGSLLAPLLQGIAVSAVLPPLFFRYLKPSLQHGYAPHNPLALYAWVSLPCVLVFFFSSAFIALVLMQHRRHVGRLYFLDLLGAGAGCGAFHLLLTLVGVERSLVLAGLLSLLASLLVARPPLRAALPGLLTAGTAVAVAAVVVRGPSPLLPLYGRELRMLAEYQRDRMQLEFQDWDPVARIDVASVRGATLHVPDRARFKLLTQDGGAPSILLGFDRPPEDLAFPDRSLLGAAYWPRRAEAVLIIGPGGGPDVLVALHYAPRELTVVELNRTTIEVVRDRFRDFTGNLYDRPGVRVVHDDGRHFVRSSPDRYDVIQLTGVDTMVLAAGGNLSENYLYTVEAFRDYLEHLTPDGILSITYPHAVAWGLRAMAMLVKVLHDSGVADPGRHLLISFSGGYVNLLAKRSPFRRQEVEAVSRHFGAPLYGLLLPLYYELWGRHLPKDLTSLYTVPPEALARQGVLHDPFHVADNPYSEWIGRWRRAPDAPEFWAALGELLAPAHDDRPFFFVPIHAGASFARGIGGLLIPTLLFIVAPLFAFRRRGLAIAGAAPLAVYFACLGIAFIAIEVVLLQKLVLLLGHPALSFAVALASLLVTTGLGSLVSGRVSTRPLRTIGIGVAGVAVYVGLLEWSMPPLTDALLREPLAVRIVCLSTGLAPLGILMGLLLPSGIRLLPDRARDFIPWAWGINASASVIGTLLALLLAIELGFSALARLAAGIYVVAALSALAATRSLEAARPGSGEAGAVGPTPRRSGWVSA